MDEDETDIPVGWELVWLTESELEELCEAADRGDEERATLIVDQAYARLYGQFVM